MDDIPTAFESYNATSKILKEKSIDFRLKTKQKRKKIIIMKIRKWIKSTTNCGRFVAGVEINLGDFSSDTKIMPTKEELKEVSNLFENRGYKVSIKDLRPMTNSFIFKISWAKNNLIKLK